MVEMFYHTEHIIKYLTFEAFFLLFRENIRLEFNELPLIDSIYNVEKNWSISPEKLQTSFDVTVRLRIGVEWILKYLHVRQGSQKITKCIKHTNCVPG